MNAARAPVVSVDVPSGVDASTGEIADVAVEADLTVTFHAHEGRVSSSPPAGSSAGRVVVADIGLDDAPHAGAPRDAGDPRRGPPSWRSRHEVLVRLRARRRRAAGDGRRRVPDGDGGAARGRRVRDARGSGGVAARRGGTRARAGQARVERRRRGREARSCGGAGERARDRARARSLGGARRALVRALLERIDLPAVVDADGLFALEPVERRSATVLTPHAGELARLLGRDSAWVDAHRLAAAREGAQRFGAVVLLKGADTIVASPDRRRRRLRRRATRARDGRDRRRAHRSRGGVSRERARRDDRGRRRSGRARARRRACGHPRPGSSRATS